jgi:hypothetical protein
MHKTSIHDPHKQNQTQTPQNRRIKPCTEMPQKTQKRHKENTRAKRRKSTQFHTTRGHLLYKIMKKNLSYEAEKLGSSLDGGVAF